MISTFKRNRHFRKVFVNKTFTHVQEQKKAMSPRHSAYIPSTVKSPLLYKKTVQRSAGNKVILLRYSFNVDIYRACLILLLFLLRVIAFTFY